MSGAAPTAEEALGFLDVNAVRRWAVLIRSVLAARRAEIDAMNVFPVPDGDTGTNLYLTVDAAIDQMLEIEPAQTAGEVCVHFADCLLRTGRGNSGVILSQLARGLAEVCRDAEHIDGPLLRAGLARANERAWEAVSDPKEGTILSVSRAMAEGAAASTDDSLYAVSAAALSSAQEALEKTPEQLEVLARAGVVDAGGAGLVLVLEGLERLTAGDDGRALLRLRADDRRSRFRPDAQAHGSLHVTRPLDAASSDSALELGPEYEVMYLLADSTPEQVETLRAGLVALGDSVLVVGGDGVWNVHAHVDDVGAAIEAGIEAGRPHRVRVTRLLAGDTVEAQSAPQAHPDTVATGIVACTAGDGLTQLFRDAGATVVPSGPGHRASTGQLIDAVREIRASGVEGVVILPNDGDTELAAAAAARAVADEGIEALVVRARTVVQGIAALAVYEPAASPAANVLGMQSAASATRHGAVTIANREALTSGGSCRPGDVLGVVDGDIVIVGSDQAEVGAEVVRRLLSSGGELLTVVSGSDAPSGLVSAVAAAARAERRDIEVTRIHGGQPVYSVLLGVE